MSPNEHHLFFRLPKEQIAYVRFIVESYEGLAQVTSLPGRGEMEWLIPTQLLIEAERLALALAKEVIGMVAIPRPLDWPPASPPGEKKD